MPTHSPGRYAARLGLFALISEPVFDWAFLAGYSGRASKCLWDTGAGHAGAAVPGQSPARWMGWLGAVACGLCAQLLATDYGLLGVGLIVRFVSDPAKPAATGHLGAALTFYQLPAPLAFLLTARYDGQRAGAARCSGGSTIGSTRCTCWHWGCWPIHWGCADAAPFCFILRGCLRRETLHPQ